MGKCLYAAELLVALPLKCAFADEGISITCVVFAGFCSVVAGPIERIVTGNCIVIEVIVAAVELQLDSW